MFPSTIPVWIANRPQCAEDSVKRRERPALVIALGAMLLWAGCTGVQTPPCAIPVQAVPSNPGGARLVFLWPRTSCDAVGYYRIVDGEGRFLANVTSGSQVTAFVAEGSFTIAAWNPEREAHRELPNEREVAVMHATVLAGATYYVQLAFGEWATLRPIETYVSPRRGQLPFRTCASRDPMLIPVAPRTDAWPKLQSWRTDLPVFVSDRDQGQRAIASDPEVKDHITRADSRWSQIAPALLPSITLYADDGVVDR
jgi:hypothetical protein